MKVEERDMKNLLIVLAILLAIVALTACDQSKPDTEVLQAPPVPVLTQPASSQQCPNGGVQVTIGSAISVLCNGLDGNTGGLGPVGPKGSPGLDATPVEAIQLCPGVDTYPSVFTEYALCLDNQLYAVYSIPNAFLTLLTPGSYTSKGIGSACNLTVAPNCVVTH